jgi:hypothetical protein
MIARFDHRPMLTAALALTTILLFVVVVTLSVVLITAEPPAETSSSQSGGANPGAAVPGTGDFYGEGWNNYGHDMDRTRPAKTGNGADSAIDRHAEVVERLGDGSLR